MMAWHLVQTDGGRWAATLPRFAVVTAVTVAFACFARLVRGVTVSGAVAGGVVCFVLFSCAGPGALAGLFCLFAVTWVATRFGRARKQRMGTAEHRDGRNASQVLANLSVASVCALLFAFRREPAWVVAMVAALAEAAADTVSSECGQAFSQEARLVISFRKVPAGTDGGITLAGTAFGLAGAFLVALASVATGLFPMRWVWLVCAAGGLGMFGDSLLGALIERRGWLNNNQVNFAGTLIGALIAAGLFRFFG